MPHIRKTKIKTQMSDRKRSREKKEEEDKSCEFHLCLASGAFIRKIKGAASKMSFTLFKTLLHSGGDLPLRPPYTKGTTSNCLHHNHNRGLYRIRTLKLVQRLAKMTYWKTTETKENTHTGTNGGVQNCPHPGILCYYFIRQEPSIQALHRALL